MKNKQTLKIVLVHPDLVPNVSVLNDLLKGLPIRVLVTFKVDDMKIIETGIAITKKP